MLEAARTTHELTVRVLAAVLLIVCIWRIEVVNNTIQTDPNTGSGQTITHAGVVTERFIDEVQETWARRHLDAVREANRIQSTLDANREDSQ